MRASLDTVRWVFASGTAWNSPDHEFIITTALVVVRVRSSEHIIRNVRAYSIPRLVYTPSNDQHASHNLALVQKYIQSHWIFVGMLFTAATLIPRANCFPTFA